MPPPPPPSKSYLLVFDTDSSEDDDQDDKERDEVIRRQISATSMLPNDVTLVELPEHHHEYDYNGKPTTSSAVVPLTTSFQESNLISPVKDHDSDDDHDDDDEEENQDEDQDRIHPKSPGSSSQSCTMFSQSKTFSSKNKKKRRRRRHRGNKQTGVTNDNNNKKKNVSFGTVQIRRFERTLGGDGVPADGGWPLGLGSIIRDGDDETPIPVPEYDSRAQQELRERWRALFPSESEQPPPAILETRQWDYKKDRNAKGNSIRNPLFGSLSEDQRNNLLVHGKAIFSKISPLSSNKKKNAGTHHGRPRANSMDQNAGRAGSASIMTRSTTSGGNGAINHASIGRPRSQSIDINAGPFDPIYVRHVRKELEDLRYARSKNDEGCSCRKLHINPKKMSASKLREELRKRHALPSNGGTTMSSSTNVMTTTTRLELENLLRRLVEEEPCCSSQNDCPCVKYGLGCQADACSCWNHRGDETPKTVMEIKERCRNKFGMYVVDFEYIGRYRKSMLCQFITTS